MVGLGTDHGVQTVALLTDMATPLGRTAGNALEVRESSRCWPAAAPPTSSNSPWRWPARCWTRRGCRDADPAEALADGSAMDAWRRMIAAQGGDPDATLPVAREQQVVTAPVDGVLIRLDAYDVGVAAWRLGAGRARKEDPVQAGAGRRAARQAGRPGAGGRAAAHPAHRRPERFEPAAGGAGGRVRRRAAGGPAHLAPRSRSTVSAEPPSQVSRATAGALSHRLREGDEPAPFSRWPTSGRPARGLGPRWPSSPAAWA